MSTPTSPNSADRALDLHDHAMIAASRLVMFPKTTLPEITATIEDQMSKFFEESRSSAVAEAVAGLEKELAKADWMLAAVDLNRSGWAPSFIDEVTEGACKGPHKGPAELLVEACNTVDSTRKALTTAESERDGLRTLVVRLKDAVVLARKGMSAGYYDGDPEDILDKALSLVPASLADCVVVKRGEWDELNERLKSYESIFRQASVATDVAAACRDAEIRGEMWHQELLRCRVELTALAAANSDRESLRACVVRLAACMERIIELHRLEYLVGQEDGGRVAHAMRDAKKELTALREAGRAGGES